MMLLLAPGKQVTAGTVGCSMLHSNSNTTADTEDLLFLEGCNVTILILVLVGLVLIVVVLLLLLILGRILPGSVWIVTHFINKLL